MNCKGAQEEPVGRQGEPGRGKRARGDPLSWLFEGRLVLLAFLLALPWARWNFLKLAQEKP